MATYIGAVAALSMVALLAVALPVRQAVRLDPMLTLREE